MLRSGTTRLLVGVCVVASLPLLTEAPSAARVAWGGVPPPRIGGGFAYDSARGQSVLFGGTYLSDTWTWDGSSWTKRSPAHSPPGRDFPGMAYDSARNQVVLFGGLGSLDYLGDTWTWDGVDWTRHHPAHAPSPRFAFGMAYDAARGQVVLFGGERPFGVELNDTWTWDGTDWTQRAPAHSPPSRYQLGMASDAGDEQVVLFGGNGDDTYDDTWTWDGADWTQRAPAHVPVSRLGFGMSSDDGSGQVVLFGNHRRLSQTWTWDGADWSMHSPANSPSVRYFAQLAYDGSHVVLFGGIRRTGSLGDTWLWDGTNWGPGLRGTLRLSPRSGAPGTVVRVHGSGLAAGEHVRLTFVDSALGAMRLGSVKADRIGSFTIDVTIPVAATPGLQRIRARGRVSGGIAHRNFTVT